MDIKQVSQIEDWDDTVVKNEFDDGTTIWTEPTQRREAPETTSVISHIKYPPDRTFWVETSEDQIFEFSGGSRSENRNAAGAMAVLWFRTGGFKIANDKKMIPIEIAALGKPAIATYLDTVQQMERERIADHLEISKGTVEQYVSKVRRGHR